MVKKNLDVFIRLKAAQARSPVCLKSFPYLSHEILSAYADSLHMQISSASAEDLCICRGCNYKRFDLFHT